ncbi:uncharacterized protein PV07_06442 [Cladophialophora immunda]|uniref:IgE-binding protein n=1 Tax=Cladophialophora immunda TaxID=569365 RepID=A0A0D2C641_9EURO|nr:uncharacterized protein PV07_06442 [Cladophialophora immunda]KIW26623.1 hypothetical protein PV07_06442 [Cladophialophora immunda]OQV07401.1 hypothetical protein CLAIMM_11842 [Cladophialophora immunda]
MWRLRSLIAISHFSAAIFASPHPQASTTPCVETDSNIGASDTVVTLASTVTATATVIVTSSVTSSSSATTTGPLTTPTSWLTVTASRIASPIHLLPMNAAGYRFYLGGDTVSYCPAEVEEVGGCPPGNQTVLSLCAMGAVVPGGQYLYVTPSGEVGYTQAHSSLMPEGSLQCPFTYSKAPGATIGRLDLRAFGASGLIACPTYGGAWQVFANLKNITAPRGNTSQCLGFDPLALDTPDIGAWQYT